jgi:hypothetical protein
MGSGHWAVSLVGERPGVQEAGGRSAGGQHLHYWHWHLQLAQAGTMFGQRERAVSARTRPESYSIWDGQ